MWTLIALSSPIKFSFHTLSKILFFVNTFEGEDIRSCKIRYSYRVKVMGLFLILASIASVSRDKSLKAKYFAIVGGGRLLKAPEHCFNPHQQLLIVEWLCDVIICTVSYEVHFAVYIRFSGHTDNRNIHHALYLVQYYLARYAGKHQIK